MGQYQNTGSYDADHTLVVAPSQEATSGRRFTAVFQLSIHEPAGWDESHTSIINLGKQDALRLIEEIQEWINSKPLDLIYSPSLCSYIPQISE